MLPAFIVTIILNLCLLTYAIIYITLCPYGSISAIVMLSFSTLNVICTAIFVKFRLKKFHMIISIILGPVKTIPFITAHLAYPPEECKHFYSVTSFFWAIILSGEVFITTVYIIKTNFNQNGSSKAARTR